MNALQRRFEERRAACPARWPEARGPWPAPVGATVADASGNGSFTCPTPARGRHERAFEGVNQRGTCSLPVAPIAIQV